MDAGREVYAMTWAKLLAMNWPSVTWVRTPGEEQEAADELRRCLYADKTSSSKGESDRRNNELCEAIRWLASPENDQEKAPSLREVVRAVCVTRANKRNRESSPSNECAECHGRGWKTVHPDAENPLYTASVPCDCSNRERRGDGGGRYGDEHERIGITK